MKSTRSIIQKSLSYQQKYRLFNIFQKKKEENIGSPFEFKEDKVTGKAQESQKLNVEKVADRFKDNELNKQDNSNTIKGNVKDQVDQTISSEQNVKSHQEFKEGSKTNMDQIPTNSGSNLNTNINLVDEFQVKQSGLIRGGADKEYVKRKPKKSVLPPFQQLDDGLIHHYTTYSKNLQLHSPFRWTPYIQEDDNLTQERQFQLKMKEFRMKRFFETEDEAELIDSFLFQALKNTGFDYYYDYQCEPSNVCLFHGRIDFLIYHRDSESKLPMIPVLRARKERNSLGEWIDKYNQAELVGAALWALTNMKAKDPSITTCRAIHTNGNKWRMIQIDDKGGFEKTHLYSPTNDEYERIYRDLPAQRTALGLIKFALNQPTEQEQALQKIYDFVDERKYLTELDDETKQKLDSIKKHYFFLPKFMREFFFGYK